MPGISEFKCDQCDLSFPLGWGRNVYAVAKDGKRVICPHPGENSGIHRVTGLDYRTALERGLAGVQRDSICRACLVQFGLDIDRDAMQCPDCASKDVACVEDLVGETCPKCKRGTIVEEDTGWMS